MPERIEPMINKVRIVPAPHSMAAIVPAAVPRRQKASIKAGVTNVLAVAVVLKMISICKNSTG